MVGIPEHERAAVAAGPRVGQAQPSDLRVHVAARRVRRREPCVVRIYMHREKRSKKNKNMCTRPIHVSSPPAERVRRRALAGHVTVLLGVFDELHDDGVGVGEAHLRAGQLGVQAVEELLGGRVELQGVVVHVGQALAVGGAHALRRDATQRGQPVERHLPCAETVQPLQIGAEQIRRACLCFCMGSAVRSWAVSVRWSVVLP